MEYDSTTDYQELEALARKGRWLAISTVAGSGAGHVGGPFSAMDILVALYFRVTKVRPEESKWPERDEINRDSESVTRLNFMRAVFQVCGRFPN
jgi:transketolase